MITRKNLLQMLSDTESYNIERTESIGNMDQVGTYVPSGDEALFMLVSSGTFINYLNKKSQ